MTVGRKTSVRRLMEGQPSATSDGEEWKEKHKEHNRTKTSLRHAKVIYISVWGVNGGGMDAQWEASTQLQPVAASLKDG